MIARRRSLFAAAQGLVVALLVLVAGPTGRRPASAAEADLGPIGLDLSLIGSFRAVARFDDTTPSEKPSFDLVSDLELEGPADLRYVQILRLRSDGAVLEPANDHVLHDLSSVYQDSTPFFEFEEAFVEGGFDAAELRLGIQKFAWGQLDTQNATDKLNPLDLTRPLDEVDASSKVGVPAALLKLSPGEVLDSTGPLDQLEIEGVLLPMVVPFRLPTEEERWFPPVLTIPEQLAVTALGLPFAVATDVRYREFDPPELEAATLQWATQVKTVILGVDLDLSYFDGYDTTPTARVEGEIRATPGEAFRAGLCLFGGPPALCSRPIQLATTIDVVPELDRIRVLGGGFAASVGAFTVKANGGWVQDRQFVFALSDDEFFSRALSGREREIVADLADDGTAAIPPVPIGIESDSVQGGLQVERIWEEWAFNVGGFVEWIADPVPGLILEDVDGRALVQVRRTFLRETLTSELVALWGIAHGEIVLLPTLAYQILDGLETKAGFLVALGPDDGLVGQYDDRDQFFAELTYAWQ